VDLAARDRPETVECDENLGGAESVRGCATMTGSITVSFEVSKDIRFGFHFVCYPRSRISAPTNAADAKANTAATKSAEANPPE
jgi:hypothetical protein